MSEFLMKNIISEILFGRRLCESLDDRKFVNVVFETIKGNLLLEKLLIGEPVGIPELRNLLHKRILNFEFIKLDGEIRPARGTTMMKYIPQSDHPKGIRPSSPKVATFYDLDKKAWRSVSNKSKEVVMKYGFGEKKKPVFVIKDKGQKIPDIEPKKPVEEPELDLDLDIDLDKDWGGDYDEVEKDDIEDGVAISKPDVEVIEKKPKYGFRPKLPKEPEEDLPPAGEIEDVIVKPSVGWRPKVYKQPSPEVKVLIPQPVGGPLETPKVIKPSLESPGPKPPPLTIEPEEEEEY
jgi:hypothetical protein